MIRCCTLLLCWVFCHLSVFAQSNFRKGNIFLSPKDSISGSIAFHSDIRNSESCFFRSSSNEVKKYAPGEILAFRFDQGKYYVSKFVKADDQVNRRFAEYLVKGTKNIYYLRDKKGFHFLVDYKSDTISEIPYNEKYVTRGGVSYRSQSTIHHDFLKTYFKDCPEVFARIDQIKKPDFKNLTQLAKEYHRITCTDSCISFVKPRSKFSMSFELQAGLGNYSRMQLSGNDYISQSGLLVYVWLPRASERMYFKSGFSSINYGKDKISTVKVPIQFEYFFPHRYVRPKIDLGVNYFHVNYADREIDKYLTLALSGGALIPFSKSIFLDLSVNTDILDFHYDTPFFLSHSIDLGLYLRPF